MDGDCLDMDEGDDGVVFESQMVSSVEDVVCCVWR